MSVIMLGTHPEMAGGIASVVRVYRDAGFIDGRRVVYLPTHADGFAKLWMAVRALVRFLALLPGASAVHAHTASRASFWHKAVFLMLARALGKPAILHLHGAEFAKFRRTECGPMTGRLVDAVLRRTSRIVVLSPAWRSLMGELAPGVPVAVVPNPVVLPAQPWVPRLEGPRRILFLGRLEERKNVLGLVRAAAALRPEIPDLELVCAGDGDREPVRRLAHALDLPVRLPGWVSGPTKEALFAQADLLCLPSFDEGLPMAVLEAMAHGLPVVASRVGGLPDLIADGRTGLLVPPGDAAALAEALGSLLRNPVRAAELGSAGRVAIQAAMTPGAVFAKLDALYAELGVAR